MIERRFKKDNSVFKEWYEDTPSLLNKAAELDKKEWKAARFIRDTNDLELSWGVISKNYAKLKDLFITIACNSNFPWI